MTDMFEPFHKRKTKIRKAREREQGGNKERYYRKAYLKACGLRFLKPDFEIHHLDHNWKNDDPENLVALPRQLHIDFHYLEAKKHIAYKNDRFYISARFFTEQTNLSKKVIDVYLDLIAWIEYRDFLYGKIKLNFNKLSYD